MNFCEKCGNSLSGENFCPKCGNKIEPETLNEGTNEVVNEANETANEPGATPDMAPAYYHTADHTVQTDLKTKKPLILSLIVALIVTVIVILFFIFGSGPNLKKIYGKYCDPVWSDVASDGSYLSIDTNPYDREDAGIAYYDSITAIRNINDELGLPDSLLEDMSHTSGADGKQSEEFKKIIVFWKYHPDKGLEITYKKR